MRSSFLTRFRKDRKALFGFVILFLAVSTSVFPSLFSPYHPLTIQYEIRLMPPSIAHPFGTDWFGRDVLTRIVYGSRIALGIGVSATLVNTLFGGFLGLLAGYYRGMIDSIIMRFFEVINSIPYFILILLIVSLSGGGPLILVIALGIFGLRIARITRSEVLSVREEEFVQAALSTGASDLRVLFKHIIPNSFATVLVVGTMQIGRNIILVAGLSFLGAGISPPTPS